MTEQEQSQIAAVQASMKHIADSLKSMQDLSNQRHETTHTLIRQLTERVAKVEQRTETDHGLLEVIGRETADNSRGRASTQARVDQHRVGTGWALIVSGMVISCIAIAVTVVLNRP